MKRATEPATEPARRTRVRRIADRELTRDDWIHAARQSLIEEGIGAVRVERLAKKFGVTRGGFYWRFHNLEDLQDALVQDWRAANSKSFYEALATNGDLATRFNAMVTVWVEERDYSPRWDSAMRDWGRISPAVANVVHAVDDERIDALQGMFSDAGLSSDVALVRARIVYYHQVGYYALGVRETLARRRHLLPLYEAALTGIDEAGLLKGGPPA
jgi:AcrR family transcriptional regulator